MNPNHQKWAKELKTLFPRYTKGYTIKQICERWEAHSALYCAGWLYPEEEEVALVFNGDTV